jgi:general secretion pathway protein G
MTLVEIMVVVIIIVLIATAVGVAVMPQFEKARVKSTITDATTIRSAVQLYRLDNNDCPTVEELVEADTIDRTTRTVDAWENGFVIECEGNDIYVVSAGPDGQMGTEDDIDNTGQSGE